MKRTLLLLLLFVNSLAFGQDDVWIEGRGKFGFLAAHRAVMGHLATEHAAAIEVSYLRRGLGAKAWHDAYNKPFYGITGFFGSTGNRDLLGYYIGTYGFISYPLIQIKNYTFSGKLGAGLGYGTKVYDPDNNILSIPVSTHFNAMVCLGVESRFFFGDNEIVLGLDMTHFSNGATKVPNLGINLPGF